MRSTKLTARAAALPSRSRAIFVQYQIRNWVFGHYGAFTLLNDAWSAHGAEAYFWN